MEAFKVKLDGARSDLIQLKDWMTFKGPFPPVIL